MPHECIRCSKVYADDAKEIVKGCSCGSSLFFYVKAKPVNRVVKRAKQQPVVYAVDISGLRGSPVSSLAEGKYRIDLQQAFESSKTAKRA